MKKKEKKRRHEWFKPGEEGRAAKPPKRHEEDLEVGQKALADIYGQTGLDPDPSRRKRILKKARRLGKAKKKKKKKNSSSSRWW